MGRRACGVLLALALCAASPALGQSTDLLVILPEGTRAELVDALRVELRGRGVQAVVVLAPTAPDGDEAALELARAHQVGAVLWLAPSENPLAPPDARYAAVPEPDGSRAARLPAAADAVDARTFALTLSDLLDAPPEIEAPIEGATPEAPIEATEDPPEVEVTAEPDAPEQPAFAPGDPPRIFRPGFLPRLAIGAGAVQASEPFHVSAAIDAVIELAPSFLFAADFTGFYAPGPDAFGGWVGMGFGGMASGLPGTLTVTGEGGIAIFEGTLGAGGGVVARWEWPIDWVVRLGPRVAFYAWAPVVSADPQPPDVGYFLFVGIDVLGLDVRL